mmetsp:Transcript_16562/g.14055  ORF Transcript_16562/g.14055 Transcript_16562/m.14055 type:complete len:88 (+) Transcript_16562:410-673(+)
MNARKIHNPQTGLTMVCLEPDGYGNIYYEFVSGQTWFGLRTFSKTADLLERFGLDNMDQVRVSITTACLPSGITFSDKASASLTKVV